MARAIWRWNDFSGGMSEDPFLGNPGSSQNLIGVDIQKYPRGVKLSSKITDWASNIGGEVDNFIDLSIYGGSNLLAYGGGKVWRGGLTIGSTATSVYTFTTAGLNSAVLNVSGTNNLYIIALSGQIHKISISDADTQASWNTYITENYKTYTYTGGERIRPILNDNPTYFLFGVGRSLIRVDNTETVTTVTTLKTDETITGITRIGDLIRVYTKNDQHGRMYYFSSADVASSTNVSALGYIDWLGLPIHGVSNMGNYDYVITGKDSNYSALYLAQGLDKTLVYSTGDNQNLGIDFQLYYNRLYNRKGILNMSVYNDTSDVYAIATLGKQKSINKNVLNCEFRVPGINPNINAVFCISNISYVGYTSNGAYYIGMVNHQNPPSAYTTFGEIWSRRFDGEGEIWTIKNIEEINIAYDMDNSLGFGGTIDIYARVKESDSWTLLTTISDNTTKYRKLTSNELSSKGLAYFNYIEYRVVLNTNDTQDKTPVLYEIQTVYNDNLKA